MRKWIWLIVGVLILSILGILDYFGYIWHNDLFSLGYEIKGLDVSHHQGEIDWDQVGREGYHFVYIKATEGEDFVDKRFSYNWREAKKQGRLVGAYHFFSMKSSGKAQAENFIRTVPKDPDQLPPVIDIEIPLYYDKSKVKNELLAMANRLEQHFGKKPIFYVTYDTFHQYIEGDYSDYEIWIRDLYKHPSLGGRQWLFWQYKNRGHVNGIDTFVDLNVFFGDQAEFEKRFGKVKKTQ